MSVNHLVALRRVEVTKLAKRGGLDNPGERGRHPLDNKSMSPNSARGELCQASLHQTSAANLPEVREARIDREETDRSTCRAGRGKRRERVLKELQMTVGRPIQAAAGCGQSLRESITGLGCLDGSRMGP